MVFSAIRRSLSLKVSLTLVAVTAVLISGVALAIISHQERSMEELTLDKAKTSAQLGAVAYGRLMEDGVDNGYLTVQDVFDVNYEEIKGYNWNGRPRYHTRYDFYTDRVMVTLLDRFLESPDIIAAIGTDANGYIPTHNSKFMRPVTGDQEKDMVGNRAKRLGDNAVATKAGKNEEKVLVQSYKRDTGELTWDVSSPIYVKGKHWGCFRVVVSIAEINRLRSSLVWTLVGMFTLFALVTTGVIFFMIRRAMNPLVQLTVLADEISTGEGLENPIKATTQDEVGRMAKAVDRLRTSLKAAMSRLGE